MEVKNALYPAAPEQVAAMQEAGPKGPIVMVNLLKFHERAQYPDGRDAQLSGRAAYQRYAEGVARLLPKYGGRLLFAGDVTALSIGAVETLWDEVALAEYPDRAALVAMSSSPEWREIAVHREAGLAGQLNIETTPVPGLPAR